MQTHKSNDYMVALNKLYNNILQIITEVVYSLKNQEPILSCDYVSHE